MFKREGLHMLCVFASDMSQARAVGLQAEKLATHCSESIKHGGKNADFPSQIPFSPKQKQNRWFGAAVRHSISPV